MVKYEHITHLFTLESFLREDKERWTGSGGGGGGTSLIYAVSGNGRSKKVNGISVNAKGRPYYPVSAFHLCVNLHFVFALFSQLKAWNRLNYKFMPVQGGFLVLLLIV